MKKIVLTLLAMSLASTAVLADQRRWQTHRHEHARTQIQWGVQYGGHGHGHGHGHQGRGWAPWLPVAIIGTGIYLSQQYSPPATTTVYISPPVVNDPARVAYFCQTVQQYYPNTPTCPVPWQVVSY